MLLATFHLEHEAIALADAFEAVPEMEVEAERIAAHSTEWTMPCLWVAHDEFDVVDDALDADPSVAAIVETDEFAGEKYYHLEWAAAVDERVNAYIDKEGSLLAAEATADGWEVRFRFVNRDQFDTCREHLATQDHSFRLIDLTEPGTPRQSVGDLTPDQRDALVTAFTAGFYEVPRESTIRGLADDLDISHQALSERLRRGTKNLIAGTLITADDRDDQP